MTRRPYFPHRSARWRDGGDMIVEAFHNAKPQGRRGPDVDFFEADDRRGTWSVREHSQLRQEWRERWGYIRRRPIMSSVVMLIFVLELMTMFWLFGPRR
jgi:hypothetical protein